MKRLIKLVLVLLLSGCNNDLTITTPTYEQPSVIGLECNRKVICTSFYQSQAQVLSRPMQSDDKPEILFIDLHYMGGLKRFTITESRCK